MRKTPITHDNMGVTIGAWIEFAKKILDATYNTEPFAECGYVVSQCSNIVIRFDMRSFPLNA